MKKIIRLVPLLFIVIHIIFFKNFYQDVFEYKMYSLAVIFVISGFILVNSLKKEKQTQKNMKLILLSISIAATLIISFL